MEPGEGLSNSWLVPFPFAFSPKIFGGFLRSCAQLVQAMIMTIPGISGAFLGPVIHSSRVQHVGEVCSLERPLTDANIFIYFYLAF